MGGLIPGPEQVGIEEIISNLVEWLRLAVETTGAIIIAIGIVTSIWLLIRNHAAGFNAVRLRLATFLALALEFQLGADILSTAVAPTWDKIGKLAAVAIIRTALNYFLMREVQEERAAEKVRQGSATRV